MPVTPHDPILARIAPAIRPCLDLAFLTNFSERQVTFLDAEAGRCGYHNPLAAPRITGCHAEGVDFRLPDDIGAWHCVHRPADRRRE